MIKKGKKRIMITITEEQAKIYKEIAENFGITISAFIQFATIQYIENYKKNKKIKE